MSKPSVYAVFTIVEQEGGKTVWLRVGQAQGNRDGSITVALDALPTNGRLHIREVRTKEVESP